MADFNLLTPNKTQTDPKGVGVASEFPRHVHKFAAVGQINDYIVVTNADELANALAQGYSVTPQLRAPVAEPDADIVDEAPRRRPGRPAAAA